VLVVREAGQGGFGFTAATGGLQPAQALARLTEVRVKGAADMQLSKFSFPPTLLGNDIDHRPPTCCNLLRRSSGPALRGPRPLQVKYEVYCGTEYSQTHPRVNSNLVAE
jgi:hypothetical protein